MTAHTIGISSLGIHLPPMVIHVEELARLRLVDADKYLIGLGCKHIAICPPHYTAVELAVEAAKRALSRWDGDIKDIGLLAVGTESALDMSRPLSAFVAEKLGIQGFVRSYEVKHACLGGTLALRQALEWKLAGVAGHKAALVIATDISLYAPEDPGEPTQGSGAVAMIIDKPEIAQIDPLSFSWSEPVFDFWRPIDQLYPMVNGDLSIESYKEAARQCFGALMQHKNKTLNQLFDEYHAFCFHAPFPKMVKKAFFSLCHQHGFDEKKIERLFMDKVWPNLEWNQLSGNAYCASLWIGVAKALCDLKSGKKILAYSYGSGCGAELLSLTAGPRAAQGAWAQDIDRDLREREILSAEAYHALRTNHK